MDFKKVTKDLSELVRELGRGVYKNRHSMTVEKEYDKGADVSTNFDQQIEKSLYIFIKNNYPDTGFMGEEFPDLRKDSELVWYVDPIDGTKWFRNHVPLWCVSIALVKNGNPILGIIYNPSSDQLYSAYEGGGAFLNDRKISISSEIEPMRLQIALDLTSHKYDWEQNKNLLAGSVVSLIQKYYRVRMIGNGALSLVWLAQGMFGAYVNPYRHEKELVDTAAGMIIAKEAGAEIWYNDLGDKLGQMIVAHPAVIDDIKDIIKIAT